MVRKTLLNTEERQRSPQTPQWKSSLWAKSPWSRARTKAQTELSSGSSHQVSCPRHTAVVLPLSLLTNSRRKRASLLDEHTLLPGVTLGPLVALPVSSLHVGREGGSQPVVMVWSWNIPKAPVLEAWSPGQHGSEVGPCEATAS